MNKKVILECHAHGSQEQGIDVYEIIESHNLPTKLPGTIYRLKHNPHLKKADKSIHEWFPEGTEVILKHPFAVQMTHLGMRADAQPIRVSVEDRNRIFVEEMRQNGKN